MSSSMSRPWCVFLIEKCSTRADNVHTIATWRLTVEQPFFLELCWPNFFSHLAGFNYNSLWAPSLHVSR